MKGVAFFDHAKSGCFWYRIKHPMEALAAHGVNVHKVNLNQDIPIDEINTFQVYGIYPFSLDNALKELKSMGKKIVYDQDDALELIEPTNPFYYAVKKDAFTEKQIYHYADHITVSTQGMADYARTKTDKPVTVIPNCYDPKEWEFERKPHEGIRIGFAGSCTHVEDLLAVLPAIKTLQDKYDFTFVIMGFAPNDYHTWFRNFTFQCTPEAMGPLVEFDRLMSQIKFEWVPYVDFDLYPQVLTNLSLDIGLCPLKDTPFNRSRSASKAMEYTLAGALAIASDLPTYEDPTSIKVKDGNWEECLEHYLTYPQIIQINTKAHLEWLKENRDINTQIDLLKEVYGV